VVSDPDPVTRLAAFVKLAEFPVTGEIQTVVASIARNPAHRSDVWLGEASRLLAKKHKVDFHKEGPNLLPNPGFEIVGSNGSPEGWKRRNYNHAPGSTDAEWTVVSGAGNTRGSERAVRCITRDNADTSLYAEVTLKPNTRYRLSGWVKARGLRGRVSINDHIVRAETERLTRDGDWTRVEVDYSSGDVTRTTINLLHVAIGEGYFDEVKLCELIPLEDDSSKPVAGTAKAGENIFFNHTARCVLCHMLKGQGSTVGPALDGIAIRVTPEYLRESLLEPSKVLAKGYEGTGLSPMPPMGDIFSPQELADIQAFLDTLK
jgi:mono/diheme cytochrome c family protein